MEVGVVRGATKQTGKEHPKMRKKHRKSVVKNLKEDGVARKKVSSL